MAKEAVVQIRMDSEVKESVENVYKNLGTSFAEAVRIFANQSIKVKGFPFVPRDYNSSGRSARGLLRKRASEQLRQSEKEAFMKAMALKHE